MDLTDLVLLKVDNGEIYTLSSTHSQREELINNQIKCQQKLSVTIL